MKATKRTIRAIRDGKVPDPRRNLKKRPRWPSVGPGGSVERSLYQCFWAGCPSPKICLAGLCPRAGQLYWIFTTILQALPQLLMNENKSIAIKKDSLASLTVFGNKNKEGTGEEFKVHFRDDDVGKGIMAFPHIHIIRIKKNGVLRIKNHEANCRCYEINRPDGVFDQRTIDQ